MTIYCPGCGVHAAADQKFCRSCGLDLQLISQSVAEHFGEIAEASESRRLSLDHWGKRILLTGLSMLMLLMIGAMICVAISNIFGLRFEDFGFNSIGPVVAPIALLLTFVGAAMAFYPQIIKQLSIPRSQQPTLPHAETTRKLSSETLVGSMESITEHTTELLEGLKQGGIAHSSHEETKPDIIAHSDGDV
jgi:hypothetical protein